ncbi:E3 ubiquitin-protein ligase UPL5 [Abeliophyllum distichum]|uniref:E3 ubiquitin-protein ligase UPL5 n=1 Tax=Abeliophyllum distichum TaxID=126358 RepID=A0ABD1UQE3_9LAMI
MSSSHSKRKLEDYVDEFFSISPCPVAARMRKDQTALPSSSNSPLSYLPRSSLTESTSSLTRLQFFVRMLSERTLVLQADCTDTIKTIHEKIQSITGIPVIEQRLIYRGKQLQWEKTLAECNVQNDAGLQLVGRMRSTEHPQAWQLMDDVVSLIFCLCKNNHSTPPPTLVPSKTVKSMLLEFLSMTRRMDYNQASSHLQIFISSSAPAALVMLYMSSHKPNRYAADDAIRQFIIAKWGGGSDDPLYTLCRSSLGTMVECVEIGNQKGLIGVGDIFRFVGELAAKLSHNLVLSMDTSSCVGPSLTEVQDFTAFVVAARKKIEEHVVSCGPIKFPLGEDCCLPVPYGEEITLLHGIFIDLLAIMVECLGKIDEHVEMRVSLDNETLFFGWCQYLAILKELNSISKLYKGAEELFWEKMRQRKEALCYLTVKFAKRSDEHKWILLHKEVTNFEVRRHLAMMMLPEAKDDYEELHEMLIDRFTVVGRII